MKILTKLDENIPWNMRNSIKIFMEYGELDENSHEYLMKILMKPEDNTHGIGEIRLKYLWNTVN